MPALIELASRSPHHNRIVTTHGGVIRTVLNAVGETAHRGVPITNGSIHSFRLVDGALQLVAFDDPIEDASIVVGAGDLEEQNAIEHREPDEKVG
jgi:broad specificity phosphatase PhoE